MTPGVPPRLPLLSQRLVVVTGKGGVGKTTVTAAPPSRARPGDRRRARLGALAPAPGRPAHAGRARPPRTRGRAAGSPPAAHRRPGSDPRVRGDHAGGARRA